MYSHSILITINILTYHDFSFDMISPKAVSDCPMNETIVIRLSPISELILTSDCCEINHSRITVSSPVIAESMLILLLIGLLCCYSSSSLSYLDYRVGPLLATRSLTPPRWPCLPCSMDEDCSWCKIDGIYPCLVENGKTSLCKDTFLVDTQSTLLIRTALL